VIGRLRGQVLGIEGSLAVIDAGGVGYEVMCPEAVLHLLVPAQEATLFTRQIVREDSLSLYGFLHAFERRLFDLLLTVKGCGPKVALALLGQVGAESMVSAVIAQDARILARASGVGPKLAERIALELREKIHEEALLHKVEGSSKPRSTAERADELVDALLALGYRRNEVESIAGQAREASGDVQEQLRHALRMLKK
jgi:Holliday junction DNA helicase RuvA